MSYINVSQFSFELTADRREAVRRRLVRLIFLIFWLLIFEGACRKWLFPQYEEFLFFIRAPFTLILYWMAFSNRRWPAMVWPVFIFYIFVILTTLLVMIQMVAGGYDNRYLLVIGYGWFNYFFYFPLAFIIAENIRSQDIQRLTYHVTWMVLVAMLVVILQLFSPANSPINIGFGMEDGQQFASVRAALGFVRPTGFFTSTLGQQHFVASSSAILVAEYLRPHNKRSMSPALNYAGLAALVVMIALSQSRGLFIMMGLILLFTAITAILTGRQRVFFRAMVWPLLLLGGLMFLWLTVFPTAFEVFISRWMMAWASEIQVFDYGIFGRALYGLYNFIEYIPDTPIIGYLLGFGGNAANQLDWVQKPDAAIYWTGYGAWGEGGWPRHIIELGPLLGVAFIVFRVVLTIWLGIKTMRATYLNRDPLPCMLFGYTSVVLLIGQITGHGTLNGYVWIFIGFSLAAARTAITEAKMLNRSRLSVAATGASIGG